MPTPLPPNPLVKIEGTLQTLLSQADMSLARLDGLAEMLPNIDLFIAMYVTDLHGTPFLIRRYA
jgi:hypothetical protein